MDRIDLGVAPPQPPVVDLELAKLGEHVKSLGVAQCGLGAVGLVTPLLLVSQHLQASSGAPVLRRLQTLLWTGEVGSWMWLSNGLHTALALALVFIGMATLKRSSWTRTLALGHAALALCSAAIGIYAGAFVLVPALLAFAKDNGPAGIGGAVGGIAGLVVGSVFSLVLPAFEIWVMTRERIGEALVDLGNAKRP